MQEIKIVKSVIADGKIFQVGDFFSYNFKDEVVGGGGGGGIITKITDKSIYYTVGNKRDKSVQISDLSKIY